MAVTNMNFAMIYVDDLKPNQEFYEKYLGFVQEQEFRPGEIFGKLGNIDCWIGSGFEKANTSEKSTRASVMLGVDSVGKLHSELKEDGQKVIQDEPVEMQEGVYWLQFADPSGNIVEVLGAK